ncbi:glycosyltransferase family 2 protein [Flavobacterium sp. FZUC8N2.13]|uniref:Glycosyltransferase family 2 protein n=1 Tax=Flavobacterium zubiriense TaxID=3138075 RepID=A0ABV4T7M0_9FLAO
MKSPKISIIMPTYNRAHLISETLESVLNQTFKSWECIIVDDESTDNTIEVIKPFLEDKRFVFTTKPEGYLKGANASRNYGLEISTGDYVYWFDSDDIIHPLTFETCISKFFTRSIDFCKFERTVFYDDFDLKLFDEFYINDESFFIDQYKIEKIINNELPINTCSVIWKKESLKGEKFNDRLLYAEEWEYFTRLISIGLKGISINKIFLYARKHPDSQTYEFNCNSRIRVEAKKEAALLIVQNLANKKLLNYSIKRYFVCLSLGFKEYNMFNQIIDVMQLSFFEKKRWIFFYNVLPLRLLIYRFKKQIIKI